MQVQLFIPCFIDQLYPQVAFNTVKILEKAGCTVKYNTQQTCCGQPAFNAGFWGESKDVCTKFVQDFDGADFHHRPGRLCRHEPRVGRLGRARADARPGHGRGAAERPGHEGRNHGRRGDLASAKVRPASDFQGGERI